MKRIIIIGATSCIAEHCARIWVQEPCDLVLIGRDKIKLKDIANDLKVRSPSSNISFETAEFYEPKFISTFVEQIFASPIDIALIAHGYLPDQVECQKNFGLCIDAMEINGISAAIYAEAIASKMQYLDRGNLIVIGSVAGDRGKKSNYVYGAAKALLNIYIEGLQHRLASTSVKISLIKPGPTDTPMTRNLKDKVGKLCSPYRVAKDIVNGANKNKAIIYTPSRWRLIMTIIKLLPRFVFNKLDI